LRRVRMVGSSSAGGGEVAEGAMIVFVVLEDGRDCGAVEKFT
jgi:hypothetical protein